ncbi:LysR family transcriptional regulator [Acidimangrovimonas pyrenivorans]|uniref:LysR family transcriptional regulator n=1 Tax=Acidimangrovimonas pyrenivorans TaxID=2030798 RepID=A0ABV7AJF2_9RHOB
MDRLSCDRMFVTVVELGSFSAAAARLGTSSGQASKLVARLEERLGVQLLVRSTRALALTEAGRDYHARIRPILDSLDELDASLKSTAATPHGRIRLSVPVTFGTLVLAPVLAQFAGRYPGIELDVVFSDRLVGLIDGNFDLALRIAAPRDSTLVARKLCPIDIVTVAAPGYLADHPAPGTPAELAGHACILDSNFPEPRRWSFAGGETVSVSGRLCFSNAEAAIAAARAGLGIARSPAFVAAEALRAGELVKLLAAREPEPPPLSAVYPASRHLPARVRLLIDHLAAHFRQGPLRGG